MPWNKSQIIFLLFVAVFLITRASQPRKKLSIGHFSKFLSEIIPRYCLKHPSKRKQLLNPDLDLDGTIGKQTILYNVNVFQSKGIDTSAISFFFFQRICL